VDGALHIKLEHDGLEWTVICGGELDIATAMHLEAAFDLCEQMRPESIHIDARDLAFIDSAGISALLRCAHRCKEEGVGFSLEVSEQVRAILHTAGIMERLLLGRHAAHTPG
jgi:anti-sigma B factor antagonist